MADNNSNNPPQFKAGIRVPKRVRMRRRHPRESNPQ
jgi:hypothetical protein